VANFLPENVGYPRNGVIEAVVDLHWDSHLKHSCHPPLNDRY
jgi:hypothetical protein